MNTVPVLEIGGTHVTAALVDTTTWTVLGSAVPHRLDSGAAADAILDTIAAAAGTVDVGPDARWGIAMPDPFDYRRGIGRFRGVGKFAALDGVDVRRELTARLPGRPSGLVFGNDADAFALGEWVQGAARGTRRSVGITLGTGVGSGWVVDGRVAGDTEPGVPPGGRAHRLQVGGEPLENVMSRRAMRRAYRRVCGDADADVREIADRARAGQPEAREVLRHALRSFGAALGPSLTEFAPDVVVVGGSMAGSWDLLEPWFLEGAEGAASTLVVLRSVDSERAALCGAARFAVTT